LDHDLDWFAGEGRADSIAEAVEPDRSALVHPPAHARGPRWGLVLVDLFELDLGVDRIPRGGQSEAFGWWSIPE
jgi:hypothetical protein